jgi:hypothetical protein
MSKKSEVIALYEQMYALYDGVDEAKQTLIVADGAMLQRDYALVESTLQKLPTEKQLFSMLANKLGNGNAITKTLKVIKESKGNVDPVVLLKWLFSMGTHAMIEVEKGDGRYLALAKRICERICDQIQKPVVRNG